MLYLYVDGHPHVFDSGDTADLRAKIEEEVQGFLKRKAAIEAGRLDPSELDPWLLIDGAGTSDLWLYVRDRIPSLVIEELDRR